MNNFYHYHSLRSSAFILFFIFQKLYFSYLQLGHTAMFYARQNGHSSIVDLLTAIQVYLTCPSFANFKSTIFNELSIFLHCKIDAIRLRDRMLLGPYWMRSNVVDASQRREIFASTDVQTRIRSAFRLPNARDGFADRASASTRKSPNRYRALHHFFPTVMLDFYLLYLVLLLCWRLKLIHSLALLSC